MKKFFLRKFLNEFKISKNNLNYLIFKLLLLYRKKNNFFLKSFKNFRKKLCIETGLTRSIYRDFSLSRMNLKKMLSEKKINGLKKIS